MSDDGFDDEGLCDEPDNDFFDTFFDGMAPVLETIGSNWNDPKTSGKDEYRNQPGFACRTSSQVEEACGKDDEHRNQPDIASGTSSRAEEISVKDHKHGDQLIFASGISIEAEETAPPVKSAVDVVGINAEKNQITCTNVSKSENNANKVDEIIPPCLRGMISNGCKLESVTCSLNENSNAVMKNDLKDKKEDDGSREKQINPVSVKNLHDDKNNLGVNNKKLELDVHKESKQSIKGFKETIEEPEIKKKAEDRSGSNGNTKSSVPSENITRDLKENNADEDLSDDKMCGTPPKKPTLDDLLRAGKRGRIILNLKSTLTSSPSASLDSVSVATNMNQKSNSSSDESKKKEIEEMETDKKAKRDRESKYRKKEKNNSRACYKPPVSPPSFQCRNSRRSWSKSPERYRPQAPYSKSSISPRRKRKLSRSPQRRRKRSPSYPKYRHLDSRRLNSRFHSTKRSSRLSSSPASERSWIRSPTKSMRSLLRSLSRSPEYRNSRSRTRATKTASSLTQSRSCSRSRSRSRSPFINEVTRLQQQWDDEDRKKRACGPNPIIHSSLLSSVPSWPLEPSTSSTNMVSGVVSVSFQSVEVGMYSTCYPPQPPSIETTPHIPGITSMYPASPPPVVSYPVPANYALPPQKCSSGIVNPIPTGCSMLYQLPSPQEYTVPFPPLPVPPPQPLPVPPSQTLPVLPPQPLPVPPPPLFALSSSGPVQFRENLLGKQIEKLRSNLVSHTAGRELVVVDVKTDVKASVKADVNEDVIEDVNEDVMAHEKEDETEGRIADVTEDVKEGRKTPELICISDDDSDLLKDKTLLLCKESQASSAQDTSVTNKNSSSSKVSHAPTRMSRRQRRRQKRVNQRLREREQVVQECREVIKTLSTGRFVLTVDHNDEGSILSGGQDEIRVDSNSALWKGQARPKMQFSHCEPATTRKITSSRALMLEKTTNTDDLVVMHDASCQTENTSCSCNQQRQDMASQMDNLAMRLSRLEKERDQLALYVQKLQTQALPEHEMNDLPLKGVQEEESQDLYPELQILPSRSNLFRGLSNNHTQQQKGSCISPDGISCEPYLECISSHPNFNPAPTAAIRQSSPKANAQLYKAACAIPLTRKHKEPIIAFEYNHYSGIPMEVQITNGSNTCATLNSEIIERTVVTMTNSSFSNVN